MPIFQPAPGLCGERKRAHTIAVATSVTFALHGTRSRRGPRILDSDYVWKSCCRDGRAIHLTMRLIWFEARIVGKHFAAVIL